jgi:hypothetical protein
MHSLILRTALSALATLAAGAFAPGEAANKPCSYQNLMPAYEKFVAGTAGLPPPAWRPNRSTGEAVTFLTQLAQAGGAETRRLADPGAAGGRPRVELNASAAVARDAGNR